MILCSLLVYYSLRLYLLKYLYSYIRIGSYSLMSIQLLASFKLYYIMYSCVLLCYLFIYSYGLGISFSIFYINYLYKFNDLSITPIFWVLIILLYICSKLSLLFLLLYYQHNSEHKFYITFPVISKFSICLPLFKTTLINYYPSFIIFYLSFVPIDVADRYGK